MPHGQCHGAHRKRMAPGSNQMARVAAKRHSRCQHLPRKRHPPHAAIAAQLRPMQQKPTGRHPGNGRRRHSWQGRRHVKKARRNQCQRKAGTIAPAKKLTTTSRHPTADAAYRPLGTPKRHVSTCETCRFAARNGTSQKAANLTPQPSASQSVSPSSHQPRPEHRDIDANRQQKPQPNKPCCHTVRPPPVANAHQAKQRKCSCRGTANMTEAPWKHNKNIGTNTGQAFERFWFHTHAAQPVPQWPGGLWHTPI